MQSGCTRQHDVQGARSFTWHAEAKEEIVTQIVNLCQLEVLLVEEELQDMKHLRLICSRVQADLRLSLGISCGQPYVYKLSLWKIDCISREDSQASMPG